jgi:Ca-activated chloride channel family protein
MRLSSFAYDNAAPAPIADLVVVFFDHDVRRELPVPLTEIAVSGSLAGAIASLRIEHHFAIPSEPGSASLDRSPVIDARYTYPIPGDAAVHGVTMHFGDEEIKAVLRERQEARDEFERAKGTGRAAVLVNDSGRGVLRLEVTGITPGVPLRVSTELVVLPRREADGSTTLRIPLTAAPRYTRADEDETAADASPKAISAKVGYRATLELTAPAGIEISSPTHDITVTTEGGRQIAKFAGSVLPDRDLVVVSRAPAGLSVSGQVILGETRNGRTPWLATVVAPVRAPAATAPGASGIGVPRSLILLVDRSGSMGGEKWSAAEWATRSLIAGMRDDDNMLVAAFDTILERNTEGWHGMTKLARRTMTEWIRTISPRGGTELGSALEELLREELRPGTQHELLIVTDGAVSDEARIMALADGSGWRISVLCIDSAPNAPLAIALAERGGGECWFLTSSAEGEEITDAIDRIVGLFGAPSVGDLALRVPGAGGALGRRCRSVENGAIIEVGALPAGSVRSLGGWIDGEFSDGEFRLAGGGEGELSVAPGRESGVNALVAAWQIRTLEHAGQIARHAGLDALARREAVRAGIDAAALPPGDASVYAPIPGAQADNPLYEALRALIVERSLAERVISSHTAFVGVRHKIGDKSEGVVEVPSALPGGWEPEGFASGGASVRMMRSPSGGHGSLLRRIDFSYPTSAPLFSMASPADESVSFDMGKPESSRTADLFAGSLADLRLERTLDAPTGAWAAIRVSGDIVDAEGVFLVIWDRDRTRPLLRARLTDLLAAGDRPAKLRFHAGDRVSLTLEGGKATAGNLRVELLERLR